MKIGELAKLTGLATSRIRFYEASGLIRSQRKANGYRDYTVDTVWILELVTGAQAAGFSLEEIARLLPTGNDARQHDELLDGLRRKVVEIEALQRRLEQNKAQLLLAIESIENKPEGLQCTENTQRVLERLREESRLQNAGPAR
ncbi:MerR family transcriptional regulator [Pseudomonas paraeruginosa]|uniref:MerR family transcriptional regulator n=1 Tax=Pseudomonas paraeruginosa TaxID=2994495 RepID=UPI000D14C7CF|nr:MerR family transcriptional regulator [Pseudomonas paraeruginosa]AVR68772.1 MerR family transcriptional regulator [Pseudomonas paraeruginosa]